MKFNVPQFIDVEDKIFGPFTAKMLLWMFAAGAVIAVLWLVLDGAAFFIACVPVVLLFLVISFYRPNGQPFVTFIFSGVTFFFGPKVYIWRRKEQRRQISASKSIEEKTVKMEDKKITKEKLKQISKVLDNYR